MIHSKKYITITKYLHKTWLIDAEEEQWEKDLDAELQEYEADEDWVKDVDDMLGDSDDLK